MKKNSKPLFIPILAIPGLAGGILFEQDTKKFIMQSEIKKSIRTLANCCSKIRPLNNVFVFFDGNIVLELNTLNDSWNTTDRRPIINEKKIRFINQKKYTLIDGELHETKIDDLGIENLTILKNYIDTIVLKPISKIKK
jgi:hypothetical protein